MIILHHILLSSDRTSYAFSTSSLHLFRLPILRTTSPFIPSHSPLFPPSLPFSLSLLSPSLPHLTTTNPYHHCNLPLSLVVSRRLLLFLIIFRHLVQFSIISHYLVLLLANLHRLPLSLAALSVCIICLHAHFPSLFPFTLPVYASLSSFSPSAPSVCILFFYSPPAPLLSLLFTPSPCSSFTFNRLSHLQHLPPRPSFPPHPPASSIPHPSFLPSSPRSLSTLFIFSFHCLYALFPSFLRFSSIIFTLFFHHPPRLQYLPTRPSSTIPSACVIRTHVFLLSLSPPVTPAHTFPFHHSFRPHHLLICASSHFSLLSHSLSALSPFIFFAPYLINLFISSIVRYE